MHLILFKYQILTTDFAGFTNILKLKNYIYYNRMFVRCIHFDKERKTREAYLDMVMARYQPDVMSMGDTNNNFPLDVTGI